MCAGISEMPRTEPLLAMIWFLIDVVHKPRRIKSLTRWRLTQMNSPESTRLV